MSLFDAGEKIERDPVLGDDTWELFEAIESSFAVDLGDYYALCGKTIRELAEEINEKANYPSKEKCLSAVVFYRLRRTFVELFSTPRDAVRPSTPLNELLPWRSRKVRWKLIQDHARLELPGLAYPGWTLVFALLAPAVLLTLLKVRFGLPLGPVAIIFWSIGLVVPVVSALSPLARVLPLQSGTVGELTKVVLANNYGGLASHYGGSSEDDVLSALLQLVAMKTGRKVEDVLPEMRIPQDLNIY